MIIGFFFWSYFSLITLHAKHSGTVYCNRSCQWRAGGVCYHDNSKLRASCIDFHQTWSVGEGSDHLQLIKFWLSCTPGKGVCGGRKFLAPPYYSQRAVFASLWVLFSFSTWFCGRLSWSWVSRWWHIICILVYVQDARQIQHRLKIHEQ